MNTKKVVGLVTVAVATLLVYTQLTLFVIQPIGALPEGRTLVIWRREKTQFIDSADAFCEREQGGVNLLCRAAVLGGIAQTDGILLRLPYSETLYLMSTGGTTYSK